METQPLIIIDPGHGGAGEPVGGSSPNRASGLGGEVLEKSLTLAIAEQLEHCGTAPLSMTSELTTTDHQAAIATS